MNKLTKNELMKLYDEGKNLSGKPIFIDFYARIRALPGGGRRAPRRSPGGRATYHQYLKHLHYYFHSLQ